MIKSIYDFFLVEANITHFEKQVEVNNANLSENYLSTCGNKEIYGGYQLINSQIEFKQSFTELNYHHLVRVKFNFFKIDEWDDTIDAVSLYID